MGRARQVDQVVGLIHLGQRAGGARPPPARTDLLLPGALRPYDGVGTNFWIRELS